MTHGAGTATRMAPHVMGGASIPASKVPSLPGSTPGVCPMTKHEYRDLLVSTSAAGGFPSVDGESCRYRAADGRKCAVGLLIPDDRYSTYLEALGAHHPDVVEALAGCIPEGVTAEQLLAVQGLHDSIAKSGPWDHDKFTSGVHEILD